MHIVYQAFHIGKFLIGHNSVVFTATFSLPAIINIHIAVTIVNQARLHHHIGYFTNFGIIDIVSENIPCVDPHRRCQRQCIAKL